MTDWKTPILAELAPRWSALDARIEGLRSLSDAQLDWTPDPQRWSVAQVLSHLDLTVDRYLPRVEAALERAPAAGAEQLGWRPGLMGRMFASMLQRPKPLPAPRSFQPIARSAQPVDDLLGRHARLLELVRRADGRPPNKVVVRTPVSALIRFNLGDCVRVLLLHGERHLGQIERLVAESGFPGPGGPS